MKRNAIHVVIIIVAVLGGWLLAQNLHQKQLELSPTRATLSKLPLGGFHKFLSDVEWMFFVNYLGSLNTVDGDNVKQVVSRLERLMSYDPNLSKIYQEGAAMISIADPVKTVEILDAACENPNLKSNSQIPFYAGFVMVQHMTPPNHKDAIRYFKMAIERSGGKDQGNAYYTSYYYRAKAKVLAGEKKLDDRHALLQVLFNEWDDAILNSRGDVPTSEYNSQDLKERLLLAVRNTKNPPEDYKPTAEAVKLADEITKKVFSDAHLCHSCATAYCPGDKFCGACGTEVIVYGLCPFCKEVLTPGAKFCVKTGQKL
jgi:hypothetical protein